MREFLKRAGLCVSIGCLGVILSGWDTMVTDPIPWQSIYQTGIPKSIPEHTNSSDLAFKKLDPSEKLVKLFGRTGEAKITIVDINASHFRAVTLYKEESYGDDSETQVEERLIPPPGLFSGLPDYSYAPYDWLNKNKACPAFQSDSYNESCHKFFGWLGALNSVHFGSQAQKMYTHHHRNALALAKRAKDLRTSMTAAERDLYRPILLEAEHQALMYEGYAQHFLQDRWVIGHMWERWVSPDTTQLDKSLEQNIVIGALSGLIHGAESVVNNARSLEYFVSRADQMSSPLPGPDTGTTRPSTAIPMEYVHDYGDKTSAPIPAIGDERLQDSLDGYFRLPLYDPSRAAQLLNVQQQKGDFQECVAAGWGEVIRALGPSKVSGTYGAYEAPIAASAPDFAIIDREDCWNMWATNKSMAIGLLGPNLGKTLALLGSTNIIINTNSGVLGITDALLPAAGYAGSRSELLNHAARMWLHSQFHELKLGSLSLC